MTGWLVSADLFDLGWRSVFLVSVPLGLAALAVAPWHVPETRSDHRSPTDLVGAGLLALTLVVMLLPLSEGRPLHWPLWTLLLGAG